MAFLPVNHIFTVETTFIDYKTGEYKDFGKCVRAIAIQKNFAANIYPLYVLSLRITEEQRQYLAANKFYLSLKIYRCSQKLDEEQENTTKATEPLTDKLICDIILRPFDNSKYIPIINENEIDRNLENAKQQLVDYDLTCVPKEQLQINNSILNYCYEGANLNEVIINLISEVYTKKIYFQESTNITRYDSLLVPPLSLIPALKYINDNYLIYNNRLNMFFEHDKLYIYDILDKSRKFTNNFDFEVKSTTDDDQTKYRSTYVDENNNIKKYSTNDPIFTSNIDISRYDSGEQVIYNSYDDNFNLVTRAYNLNESENDSADKKTRYLWNYDKEQSYESKNLSTIGLFAQIGFNNFDPSLLEPDTLVTITTATEKVNGQYCILGIDEYFTSNDLSNFKNTVMLNIGKI